MSTDPLAVAEARFRALVGGWIPTVEDLAAVILCSVQSDEPTRSAARARLVRAGLPTFDDTKQDRILVLRRIVSGDPVHVDDSRRLDILFSSMQSCRASKFGDLDFVRSRLSELLPEGCELDPHQVEAVGAILAAGGKFLLCDEQGLGKTQSALCAALLMHDVAFPLLVCCPASVVHTWARTASEWLSGLGVDVIVVDDSFDRKTRIGPCSVVVASWSMATNLQQALVGRFGGIIGDESHLLLSHTTQRSRAALHLRKKCEFRVACSGTSDPNGRGREWYVQLKFVDDDALGLFRTWSKYARRFCGPRKVWVRGKGGKARSVMVYDGLSNPVELARVLAPRMLRREKFEVWPDFVGKSRKVVSVPISVQDRVYLQEAKAAAWARLEARMDEIRAELLAAGKRESVVEEAVAKMASSEVMGALLEARIRCGEVKARWLPVLVSDRLEVGDKLVVFTAHDRVHRQAEASLSSLGARVLVGRSSMSARERDSICTSFQRGEADVILLPRAFSTGVTLTAASEVVLLERLWVGAEEEQEEDRAHRRGQEHDVICWYPLAPGTTDDIVGDAVRYKDLRRSTLQGSARSRIIEWVRG